MKSNDLRNSFFNFFKKNGHAVVPSSPLIPPAEPTLYFTNAGMVQFKGVFLGTESTPYKRAVSIQKCLRVSGKHNDLEQVGHTPRHHTFFEMMGNFSFGDYFKEEAILFAWEYLTKTISLSKDHLIATVYKDDDDALKLWKKFLPEDKIFKLGDKDNFWSMGDVGPCGPCSEILWDFKRGPISTDELDSDRFMEIWNLVFMQHNRDQGGKLTKLTKPCIDTGMGLERLACVVEGKKENWTTDVFAPIISAISEETGHSFGKSDETNTALKVIADHLRGMVFMIDAGLVPSNEGRGYILRRIIRRAVRYGKRLGANKPFLYNLSDCIIEQMGEIYTEIVSRRSTIQKVISAEEERFFKTLDVGLEILDNEFEILKKNKGKVLSGDIAFKLYDTFGFPRDLTELIAKESGLAIDEKEFDAALEKQRTQSKASWKGTCDLKTDETYNDIIKKGISTKFVGYEHESTNAKVICVLKKGKEVKSAEKGDDVEIVFDQTPFYGESGGQVGDTGVVVASGFEALISDTKKVPPALLIHRAKIKEGVVNNGMNVTLAIDSERRQKIKCNHTATHLLHKALREVLGEHVRQSGSLVEPQRLRFDFSHFQGLTPKEIEEVERLANQAVRNNLNVETEVIPYKEAVSKGAIAFFGEKYGDTVRMISSGDFSCELCGGTHVRMTGEIGLIKIVSESSIAAGIRRIEAVTASFAEEFVYSLQHEKTELTLIVKAQPSELKPKIEKMAAKIKELENQISAHKEKAIGNVDDFLKQIKNIGTTPTLAINLSNVDSSQLRTLSDQLMSKLKSGVILLTSAVNNKVTILISISKDLQEKIHAGKLISQLAPIVGGKGGGKADFAQGGGTDSSKIQNLIEEFEKIINRV